MGAKTKSYLFFFQDLDATDTYLVEYCITSGFPEPNINEKAPLMHT